jgi:hypothetical protein
MCQGDSASIHAGPLVKAVLIQGSVLGKQPSALCSDREKIVLFKEVISPGKR